ncbi:hypothetical protein CWI75_17310 [Kineobactrum sediminis]|uniref:Nucleotidyltransferase family protein n=1 Tax=Kineobactrum sediminis TaxID=1905677 RepID=A0A2N5XYH2_9GAMM|nr:nucleotidyltransferase family protein [Kineobactrum sediminis]PLW81191.1 hypothetical protein CWI75_17310 [Kineobactrum sediminis]
MSVPASQLIDALLEPERVAGFGLGDWEQVIAQARVSLLMVRLATVLEEAGVLDSVPPGPRKHLESIMYLRDCQRRAVRWEVDHLALALKQVEIPLVLLKGAAYEAAALPPGRCRLFSDFDLLVSRDQLQTAEIALMRHGWASAYHDAYDQRYYRTWMHELPPMRHIRRHSIVDVHHNLIPDSARLRPDPEKLLASSVACPGHDNVRVLAGPDMILHSAVHLFHDGEFDHGLRDLFDLRDLVTHFMTGPEAWEQLVQRGYELNLARPLHYSLRYLQQVLNLEVPQASISQLRPAAPGILATKTLDRVFLRGLLPDHATCRDQWTGLSRFFLYVRGHSLRMPLHLLLPHLFRKGMKSMNLLPEPMVTPKMDPLGNRQI